MGEEVSRVWVIAEFDEYQLPWMPLMINDLMGSGFVSMLSDVEYRAYMDLLLYQWRYGAIPDDPKRISRYLGRDIRTTKKVMAHLHIKFTGEVHLMLHSEGSQKTKCMFNLKLHEMRVDRIKIHKQNVIKGRNGGLAKAESVAAARADGNSPRSSNSETQNSELRETELKSSVNSDVSVSPTEPIKKPSKTNYSNKTCFAISQAINAHRTVFEGGVLNDSPAMKKLFVALLNVRGIDPENQRLLAYIIQSREATAPNNLDERLGYAISTLKAPKYAPADSAMQSAKELLQLWSAGTGAKNQVQEIIKNAKVGLA